MSKAKLYKLINTTLSILFALLAVYFLFSVVQKKEIDFHLLLDKLHSSWFLMGFAILLMPLNWVLETIKWRGLVLNIQEISFSKAIKSVLAGILLSLITPNRIGELGGKLIYIKKENRSIVLYLNSVCSISQLLITCLVGFLAVFYFRHFFDFLFDINTSLLIGSLLLLSIILLLVFFFSNQMAKLFSFFAKNKAISYLRISSKQRLSLFLYSLSRYIIFCMQFYFIIQIFETEISLSEASLAISLIFFLTALVPTGWISDLPVRTSIAFFIFESLGYQGAYGLTSSFLLWFVNLLIPAFGSLLLLRKMNWMSLIKSDS